MNYFKGEVQFPAALDHLFNVQVIKGRYTIEKRLRDVLEARYKSTIQQMRKKTVKQRAARNVRARPSVLPRAESRTQGMRKTIQRRTISPALRQRKLEELAKKKKSIIAEVDASEDAKVKKAQIALKEASDRGDVQQAKVLKAKMETTEHNAKKAKKGVRRRFESEAFMRKHVRPSPTATCTLSRITTMKSLSSSTASQISSVQCTPVQHSIAMNRICST